MQINKVDRILLYYPIALYAMLAGFFILSSVFDFGWENIPIRVTALMSFIVLGNFAHNFMSYWQIFRVEEFKEWSREYRFKGLGIWQIIAVTYIAFILLLYLVLPPGFNTFTMTLGSDNYINALVVGFFAVNVHHNLAQMKGIGLSHNFHYLKSHTSEISKTIQQINEKEKRFYLILFLDWMIVIAWSFFLQKSFFYSFLAVRALFLVGLYASLVRLYLKLPQEQARLKILFGLRHVYRLFFGLHPIFSFFAFAIHGADAMLIYWKSLEKTKSQTKRMLKIEFLLLYLAFAILYLWSRNTTNEDALKIMVALFLTHYVVEGFFYRMKNPTTRKSIGPLL